MTSVPRSAVRCLPGRGLVVLHRGEERNPVVFAMSTSLHARRTCRAYSPDLRRLSIAYVEVGRLRADAPGLVGCATSGRR